MQIYKGAKGALLEELKKSAPMPGEANGIKSGEHVKKKRRIDKGVSWRV